MLQSVRDKVAELGPVDAILVGGDVAFKGDPAEYDAATTWLRELAAAAGNQDAPVLVVPGNHDVDQRLIKARLSIQNAQAAIHNAADNRREATLLAQLRDVDAGLALFAPLTAYNEFAAVLGCQVYAPDNVFWSKAFALSERVQLRIFGLTSTILSGVASPTGGQDNRETIYLGALQTVLNPLDDVVNLVMCHHPPEWLRDEQRVSDQLNNRAHVQLFGHKHAGRIARELGYLRIGAGAVNPDEQELEWRPSYNFVRLDVRGEGASRKLVTETHMMEWQTNPEGYSPRRDGLNFSHKHTISLPEGSRSAQKGQTTIRAVNGAAPVPAIPAEVEVEVAMATYDTRSMIDRFWKLTTSQRRQIATKLNLLEEGETALPEPVRYGRALRRAGERRLLEELNNEITLEERH